MAVKNKAQEKKKEEVKERAEKLDPNNPANLQKPKIKKRKRIVRNDGFEHRSSKDTTDPL